MVGLGPISELWVVTAIVKMQITVHRNVGLKRTQNILFIGRLSFLIVLFNTRKSTILTSFYAQQQLLL